MPRHTVTIEQDEADHVEAQGTRDDAAEDAVGEHCADVDKPEKSSDQ
ncbi:hypothetical protein [Corynebacterium renale]|uniref:Uncharacterized protein n=1 Tax=Corynebacterium renale TaxID=1724 RepID=A0A2A9DRT6_9CORY|nr:hypothetical protein [Corynebacterium renale]PFG29101.1 hypothetical protein ATK06_2235 [Corynebacterium renale]